MSRPQESRSPLAGPIVLLVLFTLAMFFPAFVGKRFFALDFHLTFEPFRGIFGDALVGGLPLWNPWVGNGSPLLANPMHAAFYPPNLLFALVDPAAGLTWLSILHVALGAVGAFLLARELGSTRVGASAAGLVFGFNGTAISAISFCNLSWTAAWLPWILLAAERLLRRGPNVGRILAFGSILGTILVLSEPFIIAAAALGIGLLTLESLLESGSAGRAARVAGLALGVATGLALAFPFLWTVLKYLPASLRATGFSSEGMVLWSLHPVFLLNLFLPDAFGDAGASGVNRFWATGIFPWKGAPLLIGCHVGASGLALVLAGAWRRAPRRATLLLWFGVLLALALGRFGPIYPLMLDVDWFSALRYPMKWLLPAMLPVALLSARAVDDLTERQSTRVKPLIVSTLVVLGLVAAAAVAASPPFDGWMSRVTAPSAVGELDSFRNRFLLSGLRACLPLAIGLSLLLARSRVGARRVAVLLVALLGADLLQANRTLAPMVPASFYDVPPPAAESVLSDTFHQRIFVDSLPDDVGQAGPGRTHAELGRLQREWLRGYTAASYGLPLALNVDTEGLAPMHYTRLQMLVLSAPPRERLMMLGAAGATHLATFDVLDTPYVQPLSDHHGTNRPLRIYRNRLALPRARIVADLLPYDGDQGFIAAVETGPDDLFARVALIDAADLPSSGLRLPVAPPLLDGPARVPGTARIVEERNSRLRIETSGEGGFLVLSDTLVPGWEAVLDGQRVPVLRVDYAFRGIQLPAGEHELTMSYRPW